jgi:hypothetical protein
MSVPWALLWAAAGACLTLAVLVLCARIRYARRFAFFRCRLGPFRSRWRRRDTRWRLGRTHAVWLGDVLLVRSGLLRLFLDPVATGVPRAAGLRQLSREEARGLGRRPVGLHLRGIDGTELEIAVPAASAEAVTGPFLTAALTQLRRAPRDQGG